MATSKTWRLTGVALGAGLLGVSIFLRHENRQPGQEQEALGNAAELPRAQEVEPAGSGATPKDLARLKAEYEIRRLRYEEALRRLKMAAATQRQSPPPEMAALPTPAMTNAPDGAFEAKLRTSIPEGQTLAFGGWTTESGNRAVAFLHPVIEPGGGTNARVVIRAALMEVPPEVWSRLGLTDIRADPELGSQTGLMAQERAQSIIASLEGQSNCLILNRPAIQTLDGVRATLFVGQVSASNQMKGQLLDCLPQIDPDGRTINLSLILKSGPQTKTAD